MVIQSLPLKSTVFFKKFFFRLVRPDHFNLSTVRISKREKISMVSSAWKSPKRYRLCGLLVWVWVQVVRWSLGCQKYKKGKRSSSSRTSWINQYCLKVSSILRSKNLHSRKYHLDTCSLSYQMLWQIFLIYYNGSLCWTFQSWMCGCLLYNGL